MPVIILKFKDKKIKEYPIIIGQSLTIGRKQANDIVIENLAVSGFHARIDSVSSNFVLRDLESTNGTFVNNQKKEMHNLRHNDVILVGKHELIFDSSDLQNMKAKGVEQYSDEKTRILDTGEYRQLTGKKKEAAEKSSPSGDAPEEKQDKQSFIGKIFAKIFG